MIKRTHRHVYSAAHPRLRSSNIVTYRDLKVQASLPERDGA